MSLHEMMHAYASYWLGDDTAYLQGRISFNPLHHIDPFLTVALPLLSVLFGGAPIGAAKPVQVNFSRVRYAEFGAAIIGIIGPLTNLALAIIAAALFKLISFPSDLVLHILVYTVAVNASFFIINIIPWPPLDGSRLLYAFAPRPLQELMESIENLGINALLIYMLLILTFLGAPLASLISGLTNWLLGANLF
jgi:Zn-dependent protease